jgi:hypothetical protein
MPRRFVAIGPVAFALLLMGLAVTLTAPASAQVSANDMARYLAGLRVSPGSPLAQASATESWRRHALEMTRAWDRFAGRQMAQVRRWASSEIGARRDVMFYMFGGPDFAHADAFFPTARTYVLSGLEPVGRPPEAAVPGGWVPEQSLDLLRNALTNFLKHGYFITGEMGAQFRFGAFSGTLPVLYVFLARTGKTIHQVDYVTLGGNGRLVPAKARAPRAVTITYSSPRGGLRTLYYFRTNLTDAGVRASGFLKFCRRLGEGVSLIKSASYLMHGGNFSQVRDFLLQRSAVIVQDDSGIPLRYFNLADWTFKPYGRYLGPTDEFKRHYQKDLEELFKRGAARIKFGIGYRWHHSRTNILLARKR